MLHILDVTAANGVPFRVEFNATAGLITMFDRRHDFTEHGQKICQYRVDTLLADEYPDNQAGLLMAGGVPDWSIDGPTMQVVRLWMAHCSESVQPDPDNNVINLPRGGNA